MKTTLVRIPLLVIAAAALGACPSRPAQQAPAAVAETHSTIVDLEARFAAASRERGAKAAFLEFLHEESIVLQPGPTWGRAAWTTNDELPGTLDWLPDRAQISAAGDLGFASGPWVLEPRDPEGRRIEGRYVTVWKKGSAGWRVIFDGGFGRKPAGAWEARSKNPVLGPFACERGAAVPPGELQLLDLAMSGIPGGRTHQERVLAGARRCRRAVPSPVGRRSRRCGGTRGGACGAAGDTPVLADGCGRRVIRRPGLQLRIVGTGPGCQRRRQLCPHLVPAWRWLATGAAVAHRATRRLSRMRQGVPQASQGVARINAP